METTPNLSAKMSFARAREKVVRVRVLPKAVCLQVVFGTTFLYVADRLSRLGRGGCGPDANRLETLGLAANLLETVRFVAKLW